MKTLVNVSPLGDLLIPDLGRVIDAGAEFECPDDIAASLLAQPTNFELKKGAK